MARDHGRARESMSGEAGKPGKAVPETVPGVHDTDTNGPEVTVSFALSVLAQVAGDRLAPPAVRASAAADLIKALTGSGGAASREKSKNISDMTLAEIEEELARGEGA